MLTDTIWVLNLLTHNENSLPGDSYTHFQNHSSMVPNPDRPHQILPLGYFYNVYQTGSSKCPSTPGIICRCKYGMQLFLQLLTSKKQVTKVAMGQISCIRNICVYCNSCHIGGELCLCQRAEVVAKE